MIAPAAGAIQASGAPARSGNSFRRKVVGLAKRPRGEGPTRGSKALVAIGQYFGRPATPSDQAWIESLNNTIKGERAHLLQITDPAGLRAELAQVRQEYNSYRLHSGIGYVTPDDEHQGRGNTIRKARKEGMERARQIRLEYHRNMRNIQ